MTRRLPGLDDVALAGLLLIGAVALGRVSDRPYLIAPWIVATVLAIVAPRPAPKVTRGMTWLYVALPFVVVARAFPVLAKGIDLSLAFYTALFVLTGGIHALASGGGRTGVAPPTWRRPRVLFASGLAVASIGTDIDREPYAWIVSIYAALLVLALAPRPRTDDRPRRRSRLVADVLAAALVLGLSLGSVRALDSAWDDINRTFYKLVRPYRIPSPGGFSGKAELGDVAQLQASGGETIALRAFSSSPPGYLRGRVFLSYGDGAWAGATPAAPDGVERPTADGRYVLAGRATPPADATPALQVLPAERYGGHLFLPLGAQRVDDLGLQVVAWPGEALGPRGFSTARGYDVVLDGRPWFEEAALPAWRALPEDPAVVAAIDSRLARLGLAPAPEGGPPTLDVDAARQALVAHFATHEYRIGITFRKDEDPLAQWLREGTHGHCELFAAAGTLLMRRLGHAARYTTGFVVIEKNGWDDVWVARNKQAHAWVEVLHPDRGWETLELTPASGVPAASPPSGLQSFGEWLASLFHRVKGWFQRLDMQAAALVVVGAIAGAFNWLIGAWWRLALVGLLVVVTVWRRWRRKRAAGPVERALPPALAAEREQVRRLERALGRRGLARAPGETLLEWAARIEAAADLPEREASLALVRGYAARRYAPEVPV